MGVIYSRNGILYRNGWGENSYQEPLFGISFSKYVRLNFPKIPTKYKQINGVICDKVHEFSLNINPKYSDSDIYIYIKFKLNSVTKPYSPILTTEYKGENYSVIRIISDQTSTNSLYVNLFNNPSNSNNLQNSSGNDITFLMQKLNNSRVYYKNPMDSGNSFSTGTNDNLSDLRICSTRVNFNLYELFIRINGTVYHNWVPCINSLNNKCGFINSITGDFITDDNMSPIE